MKNHIENIRKSLKKLGYSPTSDLIRSAINIVCPDGENILENKSEIMDETIKLINSRELIPPTPEKTENNLFNSPNDYNPSDSNQLEEDEINKNKLPVFIPEPDEINSSEIVVSPKDKHELILDQATSLGIELSEVEVIDLSSEIKDNFLDYESFIEEIVGVIVAYNDNRTNRLEQKIKSAIEHIESRRKQLNQTLVGEFGEMNNFFRQGGDKRKKLSKIIAATFKT